MNTKHEKSPCCGEKIVRFGKRRRKCKACHRTWRVWPRKQGRKRNRYSLKPLLRYLGMLTGSIRQQALVHERCPSTIHTRMRARLRKYIAITPWPEISKGPLLAIADGMLQRAHKQMYTVHFILLRSISSNKAVIMPPCILPGKESEWSWTHAFQRVPYETRKQVVALICDGQQDLVRLATRMNWALQRCYFHLRARIEHNASFGKLSRYPGRGKKIKELVDTIIFSSDILKVDRAFRQLQMIKKELTSAPLKSVVSGFLKHYEDYRTFKKYPRYRLPITSNTAESLVAKIRDLQYRTRGFSTLSSLTNWIEALCKFQKIITCNPKKNQPN